jgi:hypothetical protein
MPGADRGEPGMALVGASFRGMALLIGVAKSQLYPRRAAEARIEFQQTRPPYSWEALETTRDNSYES